MLRRSAEEAQRGTDIALGRQRAGLIDFLTLLDTERTLATARAELAAADARVISRQLDLFRALGGGWRSTVSLTVSNN
jgi:outer membrane protein TolC